MEKSKTSNRYSPEVQSRAVRMVLEHRGSNETQSAAIAAIAPKIGCIPETLRVWVRHKLKKIMDRALVLPVLSVRGS